MTSRSSGTDRITLPQIKKAINNSGYLLEQRIEPILSEAGYFVETNPVFLDSETGKTREIDLRATSLFELNNDFNDLIFPTLLIECENNAQPVVFFLVESISSAVISDMNYLHVKAAGIPVKLWEKDTWIELNEFIKLYAFHHCCDGPTATQYCTFKMKKDREFQKKGNGTPWIALHDEIQHDTFTSLIKSTEYEVTKQFTDWELPANVADEFVDINIYYPLLILQGDLYAASIHNGRLSLRKSKHVQFSKDVFLKQSHIPETFLIDVITIDYLDEYLKIIELEMKKTVNLLRHHKRKVRQSIVKIVEEAAKATPPPTSYREYLEYKEE